jgi:predicted unusual protein kinase regulating ubiquinone biosynthesis (AarF/ABC1/UbiB family)
MDIIRIVGVCISECPYYFLSSNYDYSRFWKKCIQINILYTKLLQSIAVHYINHKNFNYHFNDIPYTTNEIPTLDHVESLKVIGSGMISIVFEGKTKNNEVCIIKAKRNNIDEKINKGLQQINIIIQWLNYLPFFKKYNLLFIFEQFKTIIQEQLQFDKEIENHKKYKKNVSYNSNIVIPDLYEEYCSPSQIVMTKLEGTHYTKDIQENKEKKEKCLKIFIELIIKNFILDGFIHSDFHPGNVLFIDNKIGILDFGLMITLNNEDKTNMFQLLQLLSLNKYVDAIHLIFNHFIEPETIKQQLSVNDIQNLKSQIINVYLHAYNNNKIFSCNDVYQIIKITNTYNLYIKKSWYSLMMFFISCDAFMKQFSDSCLSSCMEYIRILNTATDKEIDTDNDVEI